MSVRSSGSNRVFRCQRQHRSRVAEHRCGCACADAKRKAAAKQLLEDEETAAAAAKAKAEKKRKKGKAAKAEEERLARVGPCSSEAMQTLTKALSQQLDPTLTTLTSPESPVKP